MQTVSTPLRTFLAAILALGLSALPAAGQAAAQVRAEIARLEKAVRGKTAADPDWQAAKGSLTAARASLDAGRLYLSLQELEQARTSLRALETTKYPPGAFESAWKGTNRELTALAEKAPARLWGQTPVVLRALSEATQGKTMILLMASRSYADVTNARGGFYYLGEAKAAAESATFCSLLHTSRQAAPLPLRSIAPELRRLQDRTVAAFKPPRSVEHHGAFISLNATLKLAGELDAAQLHAGALYQYLDAVQQLERLDFPALDIAQQSALQGKLADLRSHIRSSKRDDSIAELFLERAEALLAGRNGSPPNGEDWKNAAVIASRVVPAYFALLKPAPLPIRQAVHPITVTLLRWPYT